MAGNINVDVGGAISAIGGVFDALFTSDDERAENARLMKVVEDKPHQDVRDIGKALVAKAGAMSWHNALGWVLAISLFMFYVPQYTMASVIWLKAAWGAETLPPYPVTADGIMELVVAMLGLAGKVTIERIAKVRPARRP